MSNSSAVANTLNVEDGSRRRIPAALAMAVALAIGTGAAVAQTPVLTPVQARPTAFGLPEAQHECPPGDVTLGSADGKGGSTIGGPDGKGGSGLGGPDGKGGSSTGGPDGKGGSGIGGPDGNQRIVRNLVMTSTKAPDLAISNVQSERRRGSYVLQFCVVNRGNTAHAPFSVVALSAAGVLFEKTIFSPLASRGRICFLNANEQPTDSPSRLDGMIIAVSPVAEEQSTLDNACRVKWIEPNAAR